MRSTALLRPRTPRTYNRDPRRRRARDGARAGPATTSSRTAHFDSGGEHFVRTGGRPLEAQGARATCACQLLSSQCKARCQWPWSCPKTRVDVVPSTVEETPCLLGREGEEGRSSAGREYGRYGRESRGIATRRGTRRRARGAEGTGDSILCGRWDKRRKRIGPRQVTCFDMYRRGSVHPRDAEGCSLCVLRQPFVRPPRCGGFHPSRRLHHASSRRRKGGIRGSRGGCGRSPS